MRFYIDKGQFAREGIMFLTNLEIEHFRGIKSGNISFPLNSRVICLIGAGDSTKSTILKAIEWVFWPSWNLIVCDNDFYECNTEIPIVIRATFKEVPQKLLSEDKYGLYLRKPNAALREDINDEPVDGEDVCLTIQLTVDKSLEPKWEIVCNRKETRLITYSDRKLLSVANIGGNSGKDMVWGKYSVLQKYADAKGILHDVHTAALREVASHADLHDLDEIGNTLISIGRQYGVDFESQIENRLLIQNGAFSSSVGLFDGNTPLNQKGTGSQRLLSMGLNVQASDGSALLVIDEVESGLEPYRLRSLLSELRISHVSCGQVIMTTHSPIAVAECTIDELLIVHSRNGQTDIFSPKSGSPEVDTAMQAQIRKNAEAFLCRRLIVCEGKTEIGFIRALDMFFAKTRNYHMAFKGVGTADGGGSMIFACAKVLRSCGYDICLLMDSDLQSEDEAKKDLLRSGVPVFDWDSPNAFEEQVFFDVPTDIATEIVNIAIREHGEGSVKSRLTTGNIPFEERNGKFHLLAKEAEKQKKIGQIAKKRKVEWYKRIDLGELLGTVVFENWERIAAETKLKEVVNALSKWVIDNDRNGT